MYLSSSLSLQPRSLSLFRHVNHPRLFISLTLSLSSATLTHFTLFYIGCFLSLSLSLSFFTNVNSHFSNMYTIPLSLSNVLAFLSLQTCSPPLFPLSLSFFLYLSPTTSLSLQPCSPILLSSVVDATCLPFSHSPFLSLLLSLFSHTHTLLSSVADMASLCLSSAMLTVTLQTRTLPPYIYINISLPLSLSLSFSLFCSLFSHAHTIYSLLLWTPPLSVSFSLSISVLCFTNQS